MLLGASASGAVVTLNPIEDTFVSSAIPNGSFGAAGALAISAAALPKGEFDTLLKFNLASAKASFDATFGAGLWEIDSVTLRLTSTAPNNPIFNGDAAGPGGTNINYAGSLAIKWMLSDAWIAGSGSSSAPGSDGVSFATLPSFLGAADETLGTFSFGGATSGNNTWTLALTPAFLADASAGGHVSLLGLPANDAVGYTTNSVNFGMLANRPLLTVTANAVPEPAAAALLSASTAMLLVRRRPASANRAM